MSRGRREIWGWIPGVSILIFAAALTGCATTLLSDDKIRSNTAGVIGVNPDELSIENRRTEMTNTYYIAKTKSGGEYSCVINGGNILTFGMVNPPSCTKK